MTREQEEIKAYLNRINWLDKRINAMQEDIRWLEESATRITPTLKEDVVSCSGSQDKVGDAASKIADLKAECEKAMIELAAERDKIARQLKQIRNAEYFEILHKRYMENKKIDDIATEMHYSTRWVQKLHRRALIAFKRVLEAERETGYEQTTNRPVYRI